MLKIRREHEPVHHDGDLNRWVLKERHEVKRFLRDPEHRRLRMLVNDIFTPRGVRTWYGRITQVAASRAGENPWTTS